MNIKDTQVDSAYDDEFDMSKLVPLRFEFEPSEHSLMGQGEASPSCFHFFRAKPAHSAVQLYYRPSIYCVYAVRCTPIGWTGSKYDIKQTDRRNNILNEQTSKFISQFISDGVSSYSNHLFVSYIRIAYTMLAFAINAACSFKSIYSFIEKSPMGRLSISHHTHNSPRSDTPYSSCISAI